MRLRLRHMGLKLGLGINRHGNVTDWRDKGAKHRTDRHGYMTGETEGMTKHGYERQIWTEIKNYKYKLRGTGK